MTDVQLIQGNEANDMWVEQLEAVVFGKKHPERLTLTFSTDALESLVGRLKNTTNFEHFAITSTKPTHHTIRSAQQDKSTLTDAELAFKLAVRNRDDLDLTVVQYQGRDRILKLSCQVWWLLGKLKMLTPEQLAEPTKETENV